MSQNIVLNQKFGFFWLNSFASKVRCEMELDSFTFDYDSAIECKLSLSHLDCTNAIAFDHNDIRSNSEAVALD